MFDINGTHPQKLMAVAGLQQHGQTAENCSSSCWISRTAETSWWDLTDPKWTFHIRVKEISAFRHELRCTACCFSSLTFNRHWQAIHSVNHQKGEKHTRCLTSYLDAVPVGCVHDSRNQVLGGLPVVVRHPGRIPGQHQHPCNTTSWGRGLSGMIINNDLILWSLNFYYFPHFSTLVL